MLTFVLSYILLYIELCRVNSSICMYTCILYNCMKTDGKINYRHYTAHHFSYEDNLLQDDMLYLDTLYIVYLAR